MHPLVPMPLAYGGNARDTAAAAAAGWPRVVSHLQRAADGARRASEREKTV
jgi:hypothetical protein